MAAGKSNRLRGGVIQTLKHTTTLFFHSHHVLLPVATAALLSLLLLFFTFHSYATLLLQRVFSALRLITTLGPNNPSFHSLEAILLKDTKQFFLIHGISTSLAFIVSWLFMVAVTHTVAAAYYDQQLSLRDVLAKLKSSWKRTLVTELLTTSLRLCYSALFFTLLSLATFTSNGSFPLVVLAATLSLLSVVRIESILHLTSTVSVLEKERGGFSALRRAVELVGDGGWEAVGLSLVLLPAGMLVFAGLYVVKGEEILFGTGETCACVVLAALVFGAWAVFYCGCMEMWDVVALEPNLDKLGVRDANLPDDCLPV